MEITINGTKLTRDDVKEKAIKAAKVTLPYVAEFATIYLCSYGAAASFINKINNKRNVGLASIAYGVDAALTMVAGFAVRETVENCIKDYIED